MPATAATETPTDLALLDALRAIAIEAGAAIMTHYAGEIDVMSKDDKSPVTAADKDAEKVILAGLEKAAADIPVVSEEQVADGHMPEFGDRFFLVDPLDGTKEFINKNGEFTVNVALVEEGFPVMGVVYAPAKSTLYFGLVGHGAFRQTVDPEAPGKAGTAEKITCRNVPESGPIAVASRSHRDEATDAYLKERKVADFTAAGSSLKFCLVACGNADLYPRLGRTMEWDTAAGHAVLAAAGGQVNELGGGPLRYGKKHRGLDNPHFVAEGR